MNTNLSPSGLLNTRSGDVSPNAPMNLRVNTQKLNLSSPLNTTSSMDSSRGSSRVTFGGVSMYSSRAIPESPPTLSRLSTPTAESPAEQAMIRAMDDKQKQIFAIIQHGMVMLKNDFSRLNRSNVYAQHFAVSPLLRRFARTPACVDFIAALCDYLDRWILASADLEVLLCDYDSASSRPEYGGDAECLAQYVLACRFKAALDDAAGNSPVLFSGAGTAGDAGEAGAEAEAAVAAAEVARAETEVADPASRRPSSSILAEAQALVAAPAHAHAPGSSLTRSRRLLLARVRALVARVTREIHAPLDSLVHRHRLLRKKLLWLSESARALPRAMVALGGRYRQVLGWKINTTLDEMEAPIAGDASAQAKRRLVYAVDDSFYDHLILLTEKAVELVYPAVWPRVRHEVTRLFRSARFAESIAQQRKRDAPKPAAQAQAPGQAAKAGAPSLEQQQPASPAPAAPQNPYAVVPPPAAPHRLQQEASAAANSQPLVSMASLGVHSPLLFLLADLRDHEAKLDDPPPEAESEAEAEAEADVVVESASSEDDAEASLAETDDELFPRRPARASRTVPRAQARAPRAGSSSGKAPSALVSGIAARLATLHALGDGRADQPDSPAAADADAAAGSSGSMSAPAAGSGATGHAADVAQAQARLSRALPFALPAVSVPWKLQHVELHHLYVSDYTLAKYSQNLVNNPFAATHRRAAAGGRPVRSKLVLPPVGRSSAGSHLSGDARSPLLDVVHPSYSSLITYQTTTLRARALKKDHRDGFSAPPEVDMEAQAAAEAEAAPGAARRAAASSTASALGSQQSWSSLLRGHLRRGRTGFHAEGFRDGHGGYTGNGRRAHDLQLASRKANQRILGAPPRDEGGEFSFAEFASTQTFNAIGIPLPSRATVRRMAEARAEMGLAAPDNEFSTGMGVHQAEPAPARPDARAAAPPQVPALSGDFPKLSDDLEIDYYASVANKDKSIYGRDGQKLSAKRPLHVAERTPSFAETLRASRPRFDPTMDVDALIEVSNKQFCE